MKVSTLTSFTLQLLAVQPIIACLIVRGSVNNEDGTVSFARITDNGLEVCSNGWGWRIDQDNHFSLTCLSGYVFAWTRDSTFAWYRNKDGGTFSFNLNRHDDEDLTDFDATLYGCPNP
jgi:hypothetical protein